MFISSSPAVIFVHVPKCGGKSVVEALRDRHLPHVDGRKEIHFHNPYGLDLPEAHLRASELRALLGESVWSASWKFATVRHPIDRLVSWYHYGLVKLVRKGEPPPFLSWDHFLDFVDGRAEPVFESNETEWKRARILQSEWLDEELEVIYKLEELQGGFFAYGSHYPLLHINTSRHESASQFPVPAAITNKFRPDFNRFGYQP